MEEKLIGKKKVTSTTYAPLQPPYQIIYYNGNIGMQIGTLIVTVQVDEDTNDYSIETHSHPVVTYMNKEFQSMLIKDDREWAQSLHFPMMEGTVWNKVELKDISTICFSDIHIIKWANFINTIMRIVKKSPVKYAFEYTPTYIAANLREYGIDVDLPDSGDYTIKLEKTKSDEYEVVKSADNCLFPIIAIGRNQDELLKRVEDQFFNYRVITGSTNSQLLLNKKKPKIKLNFQSDDSELLWLVSKLNNNKEITELVYPFK